jgi:hypothetical protein
VFIDLTLNSLITAVVEAELKPVCIGTRKNAGNILREKYLFSNSQEEKQTAKQLIFYSTA